MIEGNSIPMKAARLALGVVFTMLVLAVAANAGPLVTFQPDTMGVTANGTFRTPPIVITSAAGVSSVNLVITIPQNLTISTAVSSGNLACVTQGLGVSALFFSEWDPTARTISVSCTVTPGESIEVVRSIQFSTSAEITQCQMELGGSVTGGSGTALFGSLTISPPHTVSIDSYTVVPSQVESSGTTNCGVTTSDNLGHDVIYAWSDSGAGGSFSPSATVANPTYTAPVNETGSTVTIGLRCTVTCTQNPTVSITGSANLSVTSLPPNTLSVTSAPNSGASIAFSPSPDAAALTSPRAAPVTLSYMRSRQGIQVTAAAQDGATRPLWFDHWIIDGAAQPQGQRTITLNMSAANHTLTAVYATLVGDLNGDGHVDKADAQLIFLALLGETALTAQMNVDSSGTVDIKDARWILLHRF